MLDVDRRDHSESRASSSSSTSCQRYRVRACPGVLVWAQLVDQHHCGCRRRTASTSSSGNLLPRVLDVEAAGMMSMPAIRSAVFLAAVRLDDRGNHVGGPAPAGDAPRRAWRRFLPDAGSCAEIDAQLPTFSSCSRARMSVGVRPRLAALAAGGWPELGEAVRSAVHRCPMIAAASGRSLLVTCSSSIGWISSQRGTSDRGRC